MYVHKPNIADVIRRIDDAIDDMNVLAIMYSDCPPPILTSAIEDVRSARVRLCSLYEHANE